MGSKTAWFLAALMLLWAAVAQAEPAAEPNPPSGEETPSPAGQIQAILEEYEAAQREFSTAYQQATTDDERQKLFQEKYPQPQKYAAQLLELAGQIPDDPATVDALVWIVTRSRVGAEAKEAIEILADKHIESDKLGAVCQTLIYAPSKEAEELLRSAIEKNPHQQVQGQATYSLAKLLMQKVEGAELIKNNPEHTASYEAFYGKEYTDDLASLDAGDVSTQAERLLEKVAESYSDVEHYRGSLADAAERDLFELRNLAIGKVAPDIKGEDLDGQRFKLSDYRGKVVVLDFWGHW